MTHPPEVVTSARAARNRTRRPVTRFVVVAIGLCAALFAVQWTGAINPWVQVEGFGSLNSTNAPAGAPVDTQHVSIILRNRSLFPVDVRSVRLDGIYGIDATLVGSPTGAGRLEPGEYREVIMVFRTPCGVETGVRIEAEVVSILGRARTVQANLGDFGLRNQRVDRPRPC